MIVERIKDIRDWVLAQWHLVRLLGGMVSHIEVLIDRVEALEAAYHDGQRVYTIYVPEGMSPEIAWRHVREGYEFDRTGQKTFILADWKGDLLKVFN